MVAKHSQTFFFCFFSDPVPVPKPYPVVRTVERKVPVPVHVVRNVPVAVPKPVPVQVKVPGNNGYIYLTIFFNHFPTKPWFLRVYSTSLLKTLRETNKLSFTRSVF